MNGELLQTGERWTLRFSRRLAHSPQKVWRALTESDHLDAWFPQRIIGEWTVGAPLQFVARHGEHPAFDGEVLACEYPSLLEFRWGTDTIRLEIVPDGSGSTLTLVDTIDELGKAARDAAGWHACLDLLQHHLDETAPPWSSGERWKDVHPGYVEEFGAAAATIGPPAGAGGGS